MKKKKAGKSKGVSKPRKYGSKRKRSDLDLATSESPRAMVKKPKFWGNKAVRNVQELERVRAKERLQKDIDKWVKGK